MGANKEVSGIRHWGKTSLTTEAPKHREGTERMNAEVAENAENAEERRRAPTARRGRWHARGGAARNCTIGDSKNVVKPGRALA